MNETIGSALAGDVFHRFWHTDQPWIILGGIVLWLLLRRLLPAGSQYVLKQTLTFFFLCLLGELGASLMHALGWPLLGTSLFELALIGTGIAVIRFGGLLIFRGLLPRLRIEAPRILEDLAVFLAYGVLIIIRLRAAGMDISNIFATSAIITAILAFAMQDTLGNVLGGLAIHLDHSVEIGDWIVLDNISGQVTDIRWRYTKVLTRNGEKVVIPNSQLMKNKFNVVGTDSSRNNAWRRWIWFNIGLDFAPARIIDIAERSLKDAQIERVAKDPAPSCVLMEFGPGYLRYAMRYWLLDPLHDDPTDSVVRVHILSALEREGIPLAIPEEARHMIKENESYEQRLAARETTKRMDALSRVDLFKALTEEELKQLASHLRHAPFAQGDVMTRQGAFGDWLYILVRGEADVWLETAGEARKLLSTLSAGSVFGEMGLMTGEPRRATVIARTDADCYRLDKGGLEEIMRSRPAIAEEVSHILVARDAELLQLRHDIDVSGEGRKAQHHATVLGRIRDFFKLST